MHRGPLESPQSVHLWHELGASPGGQNLDRRGGWTLGSGQRASRNLPHESLPALLQVRPRGFPRRRVRGDPPFPWLWDGLRERKKPDFSPYPEGTGAVPTLGLGPLELFAPFRAVCVDVSQTGCSQTVARPRRRKGCAQLYLPLHCKCQKVNFLPDFFRGFQLTFP